jgi:hypothetical protein
MFDAVAVVTVSTMFVSTTEDDTFANVCHFFRHCSLYKVLFEKLLVNDLRNNKITFTQKRVF